MNLEIKPEYTVCDCVTLHFLLSKEIIFIRKWFFFFLFFKSRLFFKGFVERTDQGKLEIS